MVYFCYIDESGTPQVPGNTSHYVLCGVSIPVKFWKKCDRTINSIKRRYGLEDAEIHTGWIMRTYLEQSRIPDFENLSFDDRRREVIKMRKAEIFKVQKEKNTKGLKQLKKNYNKSKNPRKKAVLEYVDNEDAPEEPSEGVALPEASPVDNAGMPSITVTPPDLQTADAEGEDDVPGEA